MKPLLASLLAVCLASPAWANDTLKLALGQRGNWDTAIEELGQQAGIFARHGLTLDILYTKGAAESRQAVVSGSVDIGLDGTLSVFGTFAKGGPVRILAGQMTGGADYWYVRADSPIHTMKDAAGRSIAFSTQGASTNVEVLALLQQAGVQAHAVPTGDPAGTLVQVMTGQIDIGWSAPPFGLQDMAAGKLRLVAHGIDVPALRDQTIRVLITTPDDLKTKADALRRFVVAYRESLGWAYGNDAALRAYAAFAQVPEDVARRTRDEFFPKAMLQPDAVRGIPAMQRDAVSFKYIKQELSPAQLQALIRIPTK